MSANQDPTRREELLFILRYGGAQTDEIAERAVDLAISEASAEKAAEIERLRGRVTELEAQRDRRRERLVSLQNDALNMRGALSPNGEKRKIPMPLGAALTPAVEWLINRVAEEAAEIDRLSTELAKAHAAICECQPEREHGDYSRPANYMHEASCPVVDLQQAEAELAARIHHCTAEYGGPGYSHCELAAGHEGQHEAAMGNMRRAAWGGDR